MIETSGVARAARLPRLLITGFGPFPGAPENPTELLMRTLANEAPETFGASAFRAVVLPTEYRRSWAMLKRAYSRFAPDIVVHFGLSGRAEAIQVERVARNCAAAEKPDASSYAPQFGQVRRGGPESLSATLAADVVASALRDAGFPAAASDDAGDYVCNAAFYRSLLAAPADRRVGFIHVPPVGGRGGITAERLMQAALIILRVATKRCVPGAYDLARLRQIER